MIPVIPWPITLTIVVLQPVIAFAVWRILATSASKSVRAGLAIFLFGWLGLAFALAPSPSSLAGRDPFYLTPLIPLFAGGSFTVALVAFFVSPALRQATEAAPLPGLVAVQLYRALGVLFIILLALGQLPAYFAQPAGWGDIFVGLTAPLVALALARRVAGARALAVAWNAFGLLDLMVAVGMGTGMLAPVLMPELGSRVPAVGPMGVFPLILVPTFAVPLSFMLHLLALLRLRHEARSRAGAMAGTAA
jgi:hypothetical protein